MGTTAQDLAQGAEGVEITEFESFDVQQVKGVREGANGFPILMMKSLPVAKGSKDCPKCDKSYDADTQQENCENCGTKLPPAAASKASDEPTCKTCGGKGTIMDGNRDCPDCDAKPDGAKKAAAIMASWPFEPAEKAAFAALAKAVDASGAIDEGPDITLGQQIMKLLARAIQNEAQEIEAGEYGEAMDVDLLNAAASMISRWIGRESAPGDDGGPEMGMLMDSAAIKAIVAEAVAEELAKSTDVAEGETTVDTEAQGTGGLAKAVEEAVTKATADQKAEIATLRSDLAKVLARPVPGGPVLSNAARIQGAGNDDSENWAAKAALCRAKADAAIAPSDRAGYVQLAREYDEKAAKAAAAVTT